LRHTGVVLRSFPWTETISEHGCRSAHAAVKFQIAAGTDVTRSYSGPPLRRQGPSLAWRQRSTRATPLSSRTARWIPTSRQPYTSTLLRCCSARNRFGFIWSDVLTSREHTKCPQLICRLVNRYLSAFRGEAGIDGRTGLHPYPNATSPMVDVNKLLTSIDNMMIDDRLVPGHYRWLPGSDSCSVHPDAAERRMAR